jgi:hypothetical protein
VQRDNEIANVNVQLWPRITTLVHCQDLTNHREPRYLETNSEQSTSKEDALNDTFTASRRYKIW